MRPTIARTVIEVSHLRIGLKIHTGCYKGIYTVHHIEMFRNTIISYMNILYIGTLNGIIKYSIINFLRFALPSNKTSNMFMMTIVGYCTPYLLG